MTELTDHTLANGARVGPYEIKNLMHIGHHAITYRAWSQHLNTSIILKEYFPQQIAQRNSDGITVDAINESQSANFQHGLHGFTELIESLLNIEHDNIVQIQNHLAFNGTAYMIMDYEDSPALSQHLAENKAFTTLEICNIFMPLLEALQLVHDQGLCHGDIRAENILIQDNKAMLIGFSVLSAVELYNPGIRPKPTADLYQLAELMYQCISTKVPADLSERVEAIHSGAADPLKPLTDITDIDINHDFLATIDNMLALVERNRPQTPKVAIIALTTHLNEDTAQPAKSALKNASSTGSADPEDNSFKPVIWFILAGGVGLLAFIAYLILPNQEDPNQTQLIADNPPVLVEPVISPPAPEKAAIIEDTVALIQPEMSQATPITTTPETKVTVRTEMLELMEQEEITLATAEIENKIDDTLNSVSVPLSPSMAMPTIEPVKEATESVEKTTDSLTASATATPDISASMEKPDSIKTTQITARPKTETENTNAQRSVQSDQIQWHLTEASTSLTELRLTTPSENNAHYHYQSVLALDSQNTEALAGINILIEYYAELFRRAMADEKLYRADIYLSRAQQVNPDATDVLLMQQQLTEATNNQE